MRWISFKKIDLQFDHWNPGPNWPILRDIRGRNILPVINAINVQTTQSRKLLYHWCFPYFFIASVNHLTKLNWQALWLNFVFILVVFFSVIVTSRLFEMANSPAKNANAEKRWGTDWLKKRWFSSPKIDLHFDHWNPGPNRPILRDIRGRTILPVINAINVQTTQSRKLLYHWCFLFFLLQA